MEIIDYREDVYLFDVIHDGDIFDYKSDIYIKVNCYNTEKYANFNAVRLKDGEPEEIEDDALVKPCEAKLEIK